MDRNIGASFTLSVLTVLTFAVVLYQPDQTQQHAATPASTGADNLSDQPLYGGVGGVEAHEPDPVTLRPLPPPAPAPVSSTLNEPDPPVRPRLVSQRQLASEPVRSPIPIIRTKPIPGPANVPRSKPTAPPVPVAPAPRTEPIPVPVPVAQGSAEGSRGAFTRVLKGETLATVAARVYGSADEAEMLWRANRDLLTGPNGPIKEGALLRTP